MMPAHPRQILKVSAQGGSGSRTKSVVGLRHHRVVIDEPVERHGTDDGPTPLELLAGSLIGCTNVIASRIAADMGLSIELTNVEVVLELDGRALSGEAVPAVFPRVHLNVAGLFDGTAEQLENLKQKLARCCPVSLLLRQAGAEVIENWTMSRLLHQRKRLS